MGTIKVISRSWVIWVRSLRTFYGLHSLGSPSPPLDNWLHMKPQIHLVINQTPEWEMHNSVMHFIHFWECQDVFQKEMVDAKHKLWIRRNFGSGMCNAVAKKNRGYTKRRGVGKSQKNHFVTPGWPKASDQNGTGWDDLSCRVPPNREIYIHNTYLCRSLDMCIWRNRNRNKCKHTLQSSAPNLVYLF